MKLLIASDIHGDAVSTAILLERTKAERADKLILLGDILYHGPRNDPPVGYAPKEVLSLLSAEKGRILAVRGNCDAEVDDMVLGFPTRADYALIFERGRTFFLTHGHVYNENALPPLSKGDILIHGHTHVVACERFGDGNLYLNPGSVSLPKENHPKTYMVYEDGVFTWKRLEDSSVYKTCVPED